MIESLFTLNNSSFVPKERKQSDLSNEEIEPLYYNINTNYTNYTLTPENHRKFGKNKSDIFSNKKTDIKDIKKLQNPNFTRNSIGKMLKKLKEKFELRKYTKELFELSNKSIK